MFGVECWESWPSPNILYMNDYKISVTSITWYQLKNLDNEHPDHIFPCLCFPQEKAAKWKTSDGQMDGLTTNGVLVMHPRNGFTQDSKPGVWREISVCGNVFTLRETRSAQQRGKMVRKDAKYLLRQHIHCAWCVLCAQNTKNRFRCWRALTVRVCSQSILRLTLIIQCWFGTEQNWACAWEQFGFFFKKITWWWWPH